MIRSEKDNCGFRAGKALNEFAAPSQLGVISARKLKLSDRCSLSSISSSADELLRSHANQRDSYLSVQLH
jgi:hypothetical protein